MKKLICAALAGILTLNFVFTGCMQRNAGTEENNGRLGQNQTQNENNQNNQNPGENLINDANNQRDELQNDLGGVNGTNGMNGGNGMGNGQQNGTLTDGAGNSLEDNMPGTDDNANTKNQDGILDNQQNMPIVSELLTGSALSASSTVPGLGTVEGLDNTKHGWGQGTQVNELNQPESCVLYQQKYGQYGTYFLAPSENVIYLTFDEGYENGYTARILDVLKEKQVSAVFFVTMPYVKSQPDLIRRMIEEGHVLGNHSVNHPSMPTKDSATCQKEIMELHDYVLAEFGYEMNLFRPPMGEYSERTLALTHSLGYHSVFWSFAYHDWDPAAQPDAASARQKVVKAVHPGAIYLLHAVSSTNTAILGDVIDDLRAQGYTFGKFDLSGITSPSPAPAGDSDPSPSTASEQGSATDSAPQEEAKKHSGKLTLRPKKETAQ